MKKRYYFIIGILLISFIFLTYLVVNDQTTNFDNAIYNFIFNRNNILDFYFINITKLANTIPVICIVIVLLLLIQDKTRYILGIATITTVLSNQGIKHLIQRVRPEHIKLIKQGGYSYPSGHTMISIALYGFIIYYVLKHIENIYLKIILVILLTLLIISIGLSRIYLGVHYPTDVLGGYLLSIPILILVIKGVEKYD